MAHINRHIGLSLGADICWPICFEAILKRLDLAIPEGGDTLGFEAVDGGERIMERAAARSAPRAARPARPRA